MYVVTQPENDLVLVVPPVTLEGERYEKILKRLVREVQSLLPKYGVDRGDKKAATSDVILCRTVRECDGEKAPGLVPAESGELSTRRFEA